MKLYLRSIHFVVWLYLDFETVFKALVLSQYKCMVVLLHLKALSNFCICNHSPQEGHVNVTSDLYNTVIPVHRTVMTNSESSSNPSSNKSAFSATAKGRLDDNLVKWVESVELSHGPPTP